MGCNRILTEHIEHVNSDMLQIDWDMFDPQSEREAQSGEVQGAGSGEILRGQCCSGKFDSIAVLVPSCAETGGTSHITKIATSNACMICGIRLVI